MTLTYKLISQEINSTRKALRALLASGFARNGAFVGGYKRRLVSLRRQRQAIQERGQ